MIQEIPKNNNSRGVVKGKRKTKYENYIAICMRSAHSCRNEVRDLSSASVKH